MSRCLYCYKPLNETEVDYHPSCCKKIFGTTTPPLLPYSEDQLEELAQKIVSSQVTITGVQPKLSLHLEPTSKDTPQSRLTIVGLWGSYILKPPTSTYPELPEVEDLTMHLAAIAKIKVVPHSLIRLQSGNLAYITRRIDRTKNDKLHMEDMCQLTERLTENKYYGSYEQIAKAILKYSTTPMLDVINFFEQVLFSFLTDNADMHLKNFSLINQPATGYILAPAYDMVATILVNPADDEELALTLNGKKKRIKRSDFTAAFSTLKLNPKQQENIFKKMEKSLPNWLVFIDSSFVSTQIKQEYKNLIKTRMKRLDR